ncbi:IS3 family transposase [Planococcus faecalis]|uniref:IS3 family transposase n=1 Tax=Planococcus faecalis TaxID=1598147 RepID=UPI0009F70F85
MVEPKGNPYNNALAEATFEILKTELINGIRFDKFNQLALELFDYVNWYNHVRLYSSLGYASPVTYRNAALRKVI